MLINNPEFHRCIDGAAYASEQNNYPGVLHVTRQSEDDMERSVQAAFRDHAARARCSRTAPRRQ